ncbi:hypothetical protein EVAR_73774_1 [Eumeta japonica]|uniref:Uncharacterized protein n=1 Tax=Eumeta variegata TaxID=151549 RepID=A0A4C2A046_EUMVA|nr:hypothetical protein EVAR_73774_1 [Eumeta japonica]
MNSRRWAHAHEPGGRAAGLPHKSDPGLAELGRYKYELHLHRSQAQGRQLGNPDDACSGARALIGTREHNFCVSSYCEGTPYNHLFIPGRNELLTTGDLATGLFGQS